MHLAVTSVDDFPVQPLFTSESSDGRIGSVFLLGRFTKSNLRFYRHIVGVCEPFSIRINTFC